VKRVLNYTRPCA